jgi:hypothetical protein
MAVLSRVSYGAIELLQVDSNPNGTSALVNSLAVLTTDNSVYKNIDGGTTWVLFSQNATTTPNKQISITAGSKILGSVYAENGEMGGESGTTITTVTPLDDTIPQYSEGVVILTSPIYTVKSNTSKIRMLVVANGSLSTIASFSIHTHRSDNGGSYSADAEDATFAACMVNTANVTNTLLYSVASPGANTTIQYKVVAGVSSGTLTINGISGTRYLGGKYLSSILVQEIEQ